MRQVAPNTSSCIFCLAKISSSIKLLQAGFHDCLKITLGIKKSKPLFHNEVLFQMLDYYLPDLKVQA